MSVAQLGEKKNYNFGKSFLEKTIKKMNKAQLSEKHYFFGKTHSEEMKKKIS